MLRQLALAARLPPAQGPSRQAAQEAPLACGRSGLSLLPERRCRHTLSAGARLGPILALGVGGKVLHARHWPLLKELARLGDPGAVLRSSRVAKRRELRRALRDVDI